MAWVGSAERPVFPIVGGSFGAMEGIWASLEEVRPVVERSIRAVGRIEHSAGLAETAVATGFFVTPTHVLTNRHVLETFAERARGGWRIRPRKSPRIDVVNETNTDRTELECPIVGVELVSRDADADWAILRVDGAPLVDPLELGATAPDAGEDVAVVVIGYPRLAPDHLTATPEILGAMPREVGAVKSVQPGRLLRWQDAPPTLQHDATCFGGSSGSCIIRLGDGLVIGLHAQTYRGTGYGVSLWPYASDPSWSSLGITFT